MIPGPSNLSMILIWYAVKRLSFFAVVLCNDIFEIFHNMMKGIDIYSVSGPGFFFALRVIVTEVASLIAVSLASLVVVV